jgi:lysyl-tRNA synthetase class 2
MADELSERQRELTGQRRHKAESLRAVGQDPYPARTVRTHTLAEAQAAFVSYEGAAGEASGATAGGAGPRVVVAGRVTALRDLGKIAFLDVRDGSGKLQLHCGRDTVQSTEQSWGWELLGSLDLGDFVEASGTMIRTRRGEVSLDVEGWRLLTKALRSPPEKFHGLQDVEARYRQRYLDLQANPESRQVFETRSRVIAALRRWMDDRGFLEVETPVLQPEAGGAAARPFVTHFNALDEQRFLRIALELHLKRLIIGGFDKVYEVGRIFRNEGVSTRHNPEFTMMESYEAYTDYLGVAEMVEQLVAHLAQAVTGSTQVPWGDTTIELAPPWRRLTVTEAVREYVGVELADYRGEEALRDLLRAQHIAIPERAGWAKLFDALLSERVEPQLVQPTFLLDWPVETTPLAKRTASDSSMVERFESFVVGWEIANSYSELNDPVDQRQRFQEQLALQAAGDDEAELVDEDFLVALEHGMPPTGGLGIGIDRLVMVLTNSQSIRDVILFPQLRRS